MPCCIVEYSVHTEDSNNLNIFFMLLIPKNLLFYIHWTISRQHALMSLVRLAPEVVTVLVSDKLTACNTTHPVLVCEGVCVCTHCILCALFPFGHCGDEILSKWWIQATDNKATHANTHSHFTLRLTHHQWRSINGAWAEMKGLLYSQHTLSNKWPCHEKDAMLLINLALNFHFRKKKHKKETGWWWQIQKKSIS